MTYRLFACCLLLGCVLLAKPAASQQGGVAESHPPTAQTLSAADFARGTRTGVIQTPAGLTPVAAIGSFTSAVTAAPQAFDYILLHWNAQVPLSATLEMEARVSSDGQEWSRWGHFDAGDDLRDLRDASNTYWSGVIYAGNSRFWQVRVTLVSADDANEAEDAAPVLQSITINTVSTADAATRVPQPTAPQSDGTTASRPAFVSRASWGGQEVLNNSVPPDYYRADHLVVHHTADSNTLRDGEANWAARVLAEWRFHTYSTGRGWGDVGYNWLIDPNGVVYEGRRGSSELDRDAVAFHDTANFGSMGVVLIGTYTSTAPSNAAQRSLVNILAWKAQQRQIDPYGSSYYYGCARSRYCYPYHNGSVVANIAGHREVLPGHTSCPGDRTINIMPSVRQQVANLLRPTDNGDLVIDDQESSFTLLAGSWKTAPIGYDGETTYTYTTNGTSENSARWTPKILQAGRYKVEAHMPRGTGVAGRPTDNARYLITHAQGATTKAISQGGSEDWIDLGTYQFNTGSAGNVFLNDVTGEPYSTSSLRPIFYDAVRWTFVPEDQPQLELVRTEVQNSVVEAGGVVRVHFTIHNPGTVAISSQNPEPGAITDPTVGYVYDEAECYLGNAGQTYPMYVKSTGRFRMLLGGSDAGTPLGDDCAGETGGYPWRWGFGPDLQPGETRTVVGMIRVHNPDTVDRTITLSAALIQENIRYVVRDVAVATITVRPESRAPKLSAVNASGQPLARVYSLKATPQSLLARTVSTLSIVEDRMIGTFSWDGRDLNWGASGPLGQTDQFVVEQVRSFFAPTSGTYDFRLDTDDGSWLWIDGRLVIDNHGLHDDTPITTTLYLQAGMHALGFKYFEYYGLARAQYRWQPPGATDWSTIPIPATTNGSKPGVVLSSGQALAIAADDLGGKGIAMLSYWLDDSDEEGITSDPLVSLSGLGEGVHSLRYRAYDGVPNISADQVITFTVRISPEETIKAQLMPGGVISLTLATGMERGKFALEFQEASQTSWLPLITTGERSLTLLGTPGRSYRFRGTVTDGMSQAIANTTAVISVPADTVRYRVYMPRLAQK